MNKWLAVAAGGVLILAAAGAAFYLFGAKGKCFPVNSGGIVEAKVVKWSPGERSLTVRNGIFCRHSLTIDSQKTMVSVQAKTRTRHADRGGSVF
jgi:hypothetical protein